jgi:nucleoid DNA-binding protein
VRVGARDVPVFKPSKQLRTRVAAKGKSRG